MMEIFAKIVCRKFEAGGGGRDEFKKQLLLPLLSGELGMFVKENPEIKKRV